MGWYRVLTCDGRACRPIDAEIMGPLGGAFLRLPGTAPVGLQRKTAATQGWAYDPVAKADLCPSCQKPLDPES